MMRSGCGFGRGLTQGLLLALAALSAAGCGGGGSKDDVPRVDLSGKVTYAGKPVPYGEMVFTPDTKKGNKGPAGAATIKDGQYRTQSGMGPVAGAQIVRISGFGSEVSGPDGRKPLFTEYSTETSVAADKPTLDFDVPEKAAK